MITKVAVTVFTTILLVSCAPTTPTEEIHVDVAEVATREIVIEVPATPESAVTQVPVAIESPTVTPTETPLACATLLTPENGANLPVTGKVTFSWAPMDGTASYLLNFILPSGQTVSFETEQTSRDRFMEAFISGGEYQWQVIAEGTDGNEICVSEVFTFDKPAYEQPQKPEGGGTDEGNAGGDTCTVGCTPPDDGQD
jgi:hypothetical protein